MLLELLFVFVLNELKFKMTKIKVRLRRINLKKTERSDIHKSSIYNLQFSILRSPPMDPGLALLSDSMVSGA